jgi:uncharacterized membrane protein
MKEWLIIVTEIAIVAIDWMALVLVILGTVLAFVGALRLAISGGDSVHRKEVWLRFARWLVAALTFQLAADIIETSITEDWQSIGRIAAIAVIRTFLNYFLDRDVAEVREQRNEAMSEKG